MQSDYISRHAAIDALNEQIAYCDKALGSLEISMNDEYAVKVERASLAAYKEQLEALPAADVVPGVHGRWETIVSYNNTYKCSECGRLLVDITDGLKMVAKHYPYCHCGAKMDGERKE